MNARVRLVLGHPLWLGLFGLAAGFAAVLGVVRLVESDLRQQSRLVNVSARGPAGGGSGALLLGFVVEEAPQTLVIRALGPSLAKGGVPAALARLTLRVVRNADGKEVARNEAWQAPGNERLTGPLRHLAPSDPNDAACVLRLPPGGYSVLVEPRGTATGVASVEVFVVRE
jgi:hypothetical protein